MSREFFPLFIPFSRLIFLFDPATMTGNGFPQSGISLVSIQGAEHIRNTCPTRLPPHHPTHPKETKGSGEEGQGTHAGERLEVEVDVG